MILRSASPAWLDAPVARAKRTRQDIVSELMKIRLVPRSRARERALVRRRPVLGVAHVDHRARAIELARVAIDRVNRRVGDGVAVALEEAHDRDLADEELAR